MSASFVTSLIASPLASTSTEGQIAHQLESSHRSGHSTPSPNGDVEPSRDVNGKLIETSPPHFFRSPRLPQLPPLHYHQSFTPLGSAILSHTNYNSTHRQNDERESVNSSGPYPFSSTGSTHGHRPSTSLESEYSHISHDDSLNQQSPRPSTSTQVFPRLPDLAAHYGIPQLLPPAPRPTPRRPSFPTSSASTPPAESFAQVCANYLNMLSQKPEDTPMAEDTSPSTAQPAPLPSNEEAVQSLYEVLSGDCDPYRLSTAPKLTRHTAIGSPDFMTSPDFATSPDFMNEYLTSPWEDSPLDDMLTTPGLGSTDIDMLTSPLLTDTGDLGDMNLFGGLFEQPLDISKPAPPPPLFQLDNLYTLPSPITPSLDPSSLYTSPQEPSTPSFAPPSSRRKSTATGTRRNITPNSLVPFDAPTQPRKYTTPSATSRKELPAIFAKKRARTQAFGDDDDDVHEEPLPPNATEKEQIEWKRRQNTLAARKSRKRKLQHQLELEAAVERLTQERETWKIRALTYQALLKNHGHEVPQIS